MSLLATVVAQAQISIGGNVYGGGNEGNLSGKTEVVIRSADIDGSVFGGARQANVGGSTFVNIDGEHMSGDILINYVYGGNDIAGTIGTSDELPSALTETEENGIDNSYNAFILTTPERTETTGSLTEQPYKIYIGQMFGGGNGDYDYLSEGSPYLGMTRPELNKAYQEIRGGSCVILYGGGNNVTVKEATDICIDNSSAITYDIQDAEGNTKLTDERLRRMGVYQLGGAGENVATSDAYQFSRVFGGNNKAPMDIRPKWHLVRGKVRNLYSGGNCGAMTHAKGIFLAINSDEMEVGNVYGGCRMADVNPDKRSIAKEEIEGVLCPEGYAARVHIGGGKIHNVYGGNDISGVVYGGNAVGIHSSILGNVYGGGNGSYPYTDNADLKGSDLYGDFYYDVNQLLGLSEGTAFTGAQSAEALNRFRPNAEAVSVRLIGTADKQTIIGGAVYCGGNSATLHSSSSMAKAELKIGAYVFADNVFLGSNGENMVTEQVLKRLAHNVTEQGVITTDDNDYDFSQMDLTDADQFALYMKGCEMGVKPHVVFDPDYVPYSTYFGSFFCGGNVGSVFVDESTTSTTIDIAHSIIIFDKLVGGCNKAYVKKTQYNAAFDGGIITNGNAGVDLTLNLSGLKMRPMRWPVAGVDDDAALPDLPLVWNTVKNVHDAEGHTIPVAWNDETWSGGDALQSTMNRRLTGGNIYGGCYESGHVDGNVVININGTLIDRDGERGVFDSVAVDENGEATTGENGEDYVILATRSGVILDEQEWDVLGSALSVYGGGYGKNSEIWGKTTINLNKGYVFQVYGGGELGAIGKGTRNAETGELEYDMVNGYNPRYSTCINMHGGSVGRSRKFHDENMAECEYIYGGGFEGLVVGNTRINLGNGRIFGSFGGACNADILGHTETYVGQWIDGENVVTGFPWVRDHIYGGNDFGGQIMGAQDFIGRVSDAALGKVYDAGMTTASAYVEYAQGHMENIFGGCFGDYDYEDDEYVNRVINKSYLSNAFVNIRPIANSDNVIKKVLGAGEGHSGDRYGDKSQDRSYVLIDIPDDMENFKGTEIFGAGSHDGLGMRYSQAETSDAGFNVNKASAIIDLVRGQIKAVYGGSYEEGITRRTMVNVPEGSTIQVDKIFGGAYGMANNAPCDVYEAIVNYSSADALVAQAIYGGNNSYRRTLYGTVNINCPVYSNTERTYQATVYGAGYGVNTWSQYTEVNLNDGAVVYEAYGGGQNGQLLNKESVNQWKINEPSLYTLLNGYTDNGLSSSLAKSNRLHVVDASRPEKYNANVHIYEGAKVTGYCYGGGLGDGSIPHSGNVYGTTYIDLLGGTVVKDLYAAGTTGSVKDSLGVRTFVASATAYVEGGTARNVYGGGWKGSVGHHNGTIAAANDGDILGETHVVIGKLDGDSFVNGIPAVERNAYGGGEGGAVFGATHITLLNGYVGYRFHSDWADNVETPNIDERYEEKVDDETWKGDGTNRLYDSGCIFGGGYIDNSSVDEAYVKMMGGHVRNSLFGGGEIAAVGRGIISVSGEENSTRKLQGIYKAGKTHLEMFKGYVHRNVFGGGRGYNNVGEGGTLYSDGYVFGQTEVHIHGGEVGTARGVSLGHGNVFGGGDIGYVYSAYEKEGKVCVGKKVGERYVDEVNEGYYYQNEGGHFEHGEYVGGSFVLDEGSKVLTEDCKVLIEPHCKVTSAVTINGHSYSVGEYVPTEVLNTLKNKNDDNDKEIWACLDPAGIIIYNAVFAGGNTSSGSAAVYVNTTTVFGNATASIHDAYHRDFITLGTGRTGGLYGDGNLTFVDGYRGLNITNYGTDYYSIRPEIDITEFHALPAREAAYYELKYKCIRECTDKDGTHYKTGTGNSKASTITADDALTLFDGITDGQESLLITDPATGQLIPNPLYWEENGVVSIYAGRLMNTIQRADFCGVFGSRMVMMGAQDRVPEIVDYNNYTINRVREVSLNQQHSIIESDLMLKPNPTGPEDYADVEKAIHGNYFGIYNIVNFLGALSSDVHFKPYEDIRTTTNADKLTYGPEIKKDAQGNPIYLDEEKTKPDYVGDDLTYYDWKAKYIRERRRNNGTSFNKVALASGVYLELTTEKSTGATLTEKDWGYVTGVIELDLINVQSGVGGGFVYAKNEHGAPSYTPNKHNTLTALNKDAITRKDFSYDENDLKEWETSGNFVHSTQVIIDDCYNISGKYEGDDAVPAHYWYIKGSVYVYDQYISAYTGVPNAYSETVDIPLTITAASHGTMKLLNIMPNRYAYYATAGVPLESGKKVIINDVTYYKNDPISYWDWYLLSKSEQALFVEDTYVSVADCKIGDMSYPAGTVLLPQDYEALKASAPKKQIDGEESPWVPSVYHVAQQQDVDFDFVFRSSNNLSHDTGYILTYKVNNPKVWDTWYTKAASADHEKKSQAEYNAEVGYEDGPTYHLRGSKGGVLGQREYSVTNIISEEVYNTYQSIKEEYPSDMPENQAEFEPAWIVTRRVEFNEGDAVRHFNAGTAISATQASKLENGSVTPAFVCIATIQIGKTEYIYLDSKMTGEERAEYISRFSESNPRLATEIENSIVPAYICTIPGLYGGNYYEPNKNYRGLTAWSAMSPSDRENFVFNYDALDVLIDPRYSRNENGNVIYPEGQKYQYDGDGYTTEGQARMNRAGYSLAQHVDYTATYHGNGTLEYGGVEITNGKEIDRTVFELIPNEKRHYAPIGVTGAGPVYVVNSDFQIGNTPYAVGSTIPQQTYESLGSSDQNSITIINFDDSDVGKTFYFCRESYQVGHHGNGQPVKAVKATGGVSVGDIRTLGQTVPVGFLISQEGEDASNTYGYNSLVNQQTNFTIHGIAPTETSTLYVSRNSDIFDLSTEKIITVIYQYDYEESDESATHVTPISERHVVNIHIMFKSGVPSVESIKAPQIVLPGDFIGLREPNVTPGAYEVTGGGWEMFEKISDAESHTNGIDYVPGVDPLYWYQDGYYVAYYAKTYLGKTYSNHVPLSVANYHDLDAVMKDKEHHMYVDNPGVKRESKIYIDNRDCQSDPTKSELDLLKDFYDLSVLSGAPAAGTALEGHANLNSHVHSASNLEFFLRGDVSPKAYSVAGGSSAGWVPIGNDNTMGEMGQCFEGTLHGDGHTISGLDHSLFGHLCGEVYNLGITGSFSSAGIADEGSGYLENCWIGTTDCSTKDKKALFGSPIDTEKRTVHMVNCYYPKENQYLAGSGATELPMRSFYNGEVAYDLNGFYLFKRYCDHTSSVNTHPYSYYTVGDDKALSLQTGYYENVAGPYLFYGKEDAYLGSYVESRFVDGDFQYANGTIPDVIDERYDTDQKGFYPIWPDDYLFFGQALNYGHVEKRTHQDYPSAIKRGGGRILSTSMGNRVFRAPAYYRSSTMGVAHFNPYAVFAQSKKDDETKLAYKDMTAIDFSGGNGDMAAGYQRGLAAASNNLPVRFYPPLLDDGGLSAFVNADLTKNLLVYTGTPGGKGVGETPTAAQKTANVVGAYLADGAYAETDASYRTVAFHDPTPIRGHWVQQSGASYVATNDHLLVDRQDFNAPMAYHFADSKRMWYQRTPDNYVNRTVGWEGISLPFEAEIVTTDVKGELTHFYQGSEIGHEYWLREFKGNVVQKKENNTPVEGVYTADFDPLAQSNHEKDYTNTFLFDWYYSKDNYLDRNSDEYQKLYYSGGYLNEHYPVSDYPYAAAGTPYLVGFPGSTYYEFDLSGEWTPENVGRYPSTIPSPGRQYITFASVSGTAIGVSDAEQGGVTASGYSFTPTYLNNPVAAGQDVFILSADGSGFERVEGGSASMSAFRPYFGTTASAKARRIVFNDTNSQMGGDAEDVSDELDEGVDIRAKKHKVIVTSNLHSVANVRIINANGLCVATGSVKSGQTIDVPVEVSGVYVVLVADGRYKSKVVVR